MAKIASIGCGRSSSSRTVLFFRYHARTTVIVLAWVNDEATKRAYDNSDDSYRVFRKMLESGGSPDDWDRLLSEAQKESQRIQESGARAAATQR